ncbi:PilN domain-containing protein [Nocardioides ungokensis]|uniref:PilN domain-containing protein n=1 Tax=Nocardioides ungokensis TaxID=1643322 RepID=UPI0015DE0D2B|nr:PilN domain-containing protein [Nocardioides ungokensis]
MKRRGAASHPRPGLPSVNLLSQSEFDRMAVRRLRKRFVAGGVALVLLVGAGWFVQHMRVNDAQKLVAVEQAQTSRLSSQTQTLTTIKTFVTGVAAQKATVSTTMAREIYFSKVLAGLRAATPSGTSMQSISVTLAPDAAGTTAPAAGAPATAGASVCPGPDPFQTETIIGCVTLSGTAVSRAQVGELVTNLGSMGLFVEPFISTTTTGDSATSVTFSGSVGLSEKVYSHRYAPASATATDPAAPTAAAPTDQTTPAGGTS